MMLNLVQTTINQRLFFELHCLSIFNNLRSIWFPAWTAAQRRAGGAPEGLTKVTAERPQCRSAAKQLVASIHLRTTGHRDRSNCLQRTLSKMCCSVSSLSFEVVLCFMSFLEIWPYCGNERCVQIKVSKQLLYQANKNQTNFLEN